MSIRLVRPQKSFDFSLNYYPASGIDRMRVGTPPVIAMAALEASLDIWETVNINDVRENFHPAHRSIHKGCGAKMSNVAINYTSLT